MSLIANFIDQDQTTLKENIGYSGQDVQVWANELLKLEEQTGSISISVSKTELHKSIKHYCTSELHVLEATNEAVA